VLVWVRGFGLVFGVDGEVEGGGGGLRERRGMERGLIEMGRDWNVLCHGERCPS